MRIVPPILLLVTCLSAATSTSAQQNPISKAVSKSLLDAVIGPTVPELKPAAEAGDATAQFQLGKAYWAKSDYTNAVVWYQKAAKQGVADAQFAYGCTLLPGYPRNLPKDTKEALRWISLAAHQNHPNAQLILAEHLELGTLGKPDRVEAMKWLTVLVSHSPAYRVYSDKLALRLTTSEIEEAKRRASEFRPSAAAKVQHNLRLQGISGTGAKRLAIINGQTLAPGEQATIKSDGETLLVRCLEIGTDYARIKIAGEQTSRNLHWTRN